MSASHKGACMAGQLFAGKVPRTFSALLVLVYFFFRARKASIRCASSAVGSCVMSLGRHPPGEVRVQHRIFAAEGLDGGPGNLGMARLHVSRHLPGSLRDDLDVALDRLPQRRVLEVRVLPSPGVARDPTDRLADALERPWRLPGHQKTPIRVVLDPMRAGFAIPARAASPGARGFGLDPMGMILS